MPQLEFLQAVLPEGSRYSLRLINRATGAAYSRFFRSVESLTGAIHSISDSASKVDIYYATAGFGAGPHADAGNAVAKQELYLDVDCGSDKPYKTKIDGLKALRQFCKQVRLPRPTIIDSGNGYHAHWIFAAPVPIHEWLAVANGLKALCRHHQFDVDSGCTADIVRVLRVPDTVNNKNGATVELITDVCQYNFSDLQAVISAAAPVDIFQKAKSVSKSSSTGLTRTLAYGDPNRKNSFETIWLKSVRGEGCAQIRNAIENADILPEPLWRGVLSIAQVCEDRDWAIHEVSKGHPNYTPEETEAKASNTRGPYTCATFKELGEAKLCAECPHDGKITSPVQIGRFIKTADPSTPAIVEHEERKYEVPPLPYPYVRGEHGGIYIRKPNKAAEDPDEAGEELEMVYPNDLYVYKRMRDAEIGDVVWMRLHLPFDGVRDFMVSQRDVGASDKLRDKLNEQGVMVFSVPQIQKLQHYIGKSIQHLQVQTKADIMNTRFGWTKHGTFILGDREYTSKGVVHSPCAKSLEKYVSWFSPKGTLDEWRRIAAMYDGPAFDLHAFGVLLGFGSVLMALSPESGGVVNYYSRKSGTGKTTILRVINSIFGDPKAMMKDAQDTHLSKVHRMGVMNGIPVSVDEMTNTRPEDLSAMLYGSTQGRARDRMKAGENSERQNDLTWRLISIWTSNASIEDRLSLIKADPQGEMARVIEIKLQTPVPSDVLESQKTFNLLASNYGHAGHIYLNYVVPNIDAVQKIWNDTRDFIYSMREWSQTERYRLNLVICAIAAGVITNTLGLTSYNLSRITKKITSLVVQAGEDLQKSSVKAVSTIAAFINKNINNILSIDSVVRANGLQNEPYIKPRGTLTIRYEPDTRDLFIVTRDFNRWCADNFINAKEIKEMFQEETGTPLETVKKRMGTGWDTDFGPVYAYKIPNATQILGLELPNAEGVPA